MGKEFWALFVVVVLHCIASGFFVERREYGTATYFILLTGWWIAAGSFILENNR